MLKDVGLIRVAKAVSFLAWLILPFWIWFIALQLLGNELFVLYLAIPGAVLFIVTLIFISFQISFWRSHEFKIMRLIEKVGDVFRHPENKQKAEEFKDECRKFILPFTHHMPFSLSAIAETHVSSIRSIIASIEGFYTSYSIVTFFVVFQRGLYGLFEPLNPVVSQMPPQLTDWPFRNLWVSLGILWVLSLYHDPLIRFIQVMVHYAVPKPSGILAYSTSMYDVRLRIMLSVAYVVSIPTILAERSRAVMCDPFIDPLTLPRIIQKTVLNVEGKSCDVSRWDEKIETESDVDRMKELAWKDKRTPFILGFLARRSESKTLLKRIKEVQPITYIGVINDRCIFLGHAIYNPIKRIRQGRFYFDTTYLKKEFLLIYEEEVKKQRQIERKLPSELEELIKSLRLKNGRKETHR